MKTLRILLALVLAVFSTNAIAQTSAGLLKPGQFVGNNGTVPAPGAPVSVFGAVAPVGGLPLYAAPAATGTGSCLSAPNACTLATACSFVTQVATFLGQASPINLANGTYTNPGCNVQGEAGGSSSQLTSLLGNCSSPSSVIIALSGGAIGITGQDHATIGVNCIQFQSSGTGGTGIFCRQQAICDYSNVIWATWGTGGAHVSVDESSVNVLSASGGCETITANFNIHWNLSNAHFSPGCATNIPSAVSWTSAGNGFLQAVDSFIDLTGWSTTGSGVAGSTGQPGNFDGSTYMLTAAAAPCASVLPGNVACNFSNAANDNAGEGITGTGILVGQLAPSIANPIVTAKTYAGLPVSPIAGQISHIIDGKPSNCGDGLCTTPGATVTGGSGSLDLLISWDGANWRIFRANAQAAGGSGVPQNNLNTQSGNYTIQPTDCGDTINETGTLKTITLPSVSGFATNCVLAVYNASSTRGQILSGFPGAVSAAPNNILWSLDTITVEIVNGAWSIQSYVNRHKLTASITVDVDNTNGNDANDCLATTTGACKTIQGAINYIETWDTNSQAINISVADGAYNNTVLVNGPWHGNGTVTLTGDVATPANVTINPANANPAIQVQNAGQLTIAGGFTISNSSGPIIQSTNQSTISITGAMAYGASAGNVLSALNQSVLTVTANFSLSGNVSSVINAAQGGYVDTRNRTVTITGTPAFASAFLLTTSGLTYVQGMTFSGSATGKRYVGTLGGIIRTGTASATYFPGDAAGTVASGARIDSTGAPVVSSCGTSPGTANGTDFSGNVTEGTTATGCTLTFASASVMNGCTVSLSTGAAIGIPTLGATLVVAHASLSNNVLYWVCSNN